MTRLAIYLQDAHSIGEAMEYATYAEQRGFEAVWQADSRLVRDAVVPMAAFATCTDTLKIGSGVVDCWTRNPARLASTFSTLDDLAPGRVILGIGAWWEPLASKVGVQRRRPLKAMREIVEACRALLADETVTYDGEFVQLLNEAGYIEEMNPNEYHMDDLYDEYTNFPGHWKNDKLFSVIVRFGYLGVSFNTTVISHEEAMDYNILWDKKLTGKVGHFDWHLPNLGCLSLRDGNDKPSPFDINDSQWKKLQETTLSLKPQVGGYFDYGGTFASLKNGEINAKCGNGDWITGVVQKDGAPVDSVVPKQGGIQWTESYSIGKGSKKQDLAKEFVRYITSGAGQVRSIQMAAYPGMSPYKSGWKAINEANPAEAKRQRMTFDGPNCIDDLREGRIHFRGVPKQQSLEDWNDFWSEYKNA